MLKFYNNVGVVDLNAKFVSYSLSGGAVELPSYFIAWRCMERFGRRWVLCVFMCVGGLACLCCGFVPESKFFSCNYLNIFGFLAFMYIFKKDLSVSLVDLFLVSFNICYYTDFISLINSYGS